MSEKHSGRAEKGSQLYLQNLINKYPEIFDDELSSKCYESQKLKYNLENEFEYYWVFQTEGIHTIKIIFKRNYIIVVICFIIVMI